MKLLRWMLEFTGHMMLHNRPPWFVYQPDIHKVRGPDVRRILDVVEPADILLRRFDGYLNTILTPGFWGHGGGYVGDNQMVHAVSQGTISEDILNFCRADAICVLEVDVSAEEKALAVQRLKISAEEKVPYDFDFSRKNKTAYCTERLDIAFGGIFYADYVETFGQLVLLPNGIRYSKHVKVKLEINRKHFKRGEDHGKFNT